MTWNVQSLFLSSFAVDRVDCLTKLEQLAAVNDRVGPDVLALQEVGGPQVLDDLNARFAIDFDHRVVGVADGRGIRLALLSQRRLSNVTNRQTFPAQVGLVQFRDLSPDDPGTVVDESATDRTSRGVLAATAGPGGRRVTVLTRHLKSKLISYPPLRPGRGTRFSPRDEGERLRYAGFALHRRTSEAMVTRAVRRRVGQGQVPAR